MSISITIDLIYLVSATLFIYGLKNLSKVATARSGNFLAIGGMLLAVAGTLLNHQLVYFGWILFGIGIGSAIGAVFAITVKMTAMPQMVALFNGFGGLASALVACSEYLKSSSNMAELLPIELGTLIGTLTFTGSLIAFGKLQGIVNQKPMTYFFQNVFNLTLFLVVLTAAILLLISPAVYYFWIVLIGAALLGLLLVLPIGGADMPVVISLLNSYSGIAAAVTGFVLDNKILIIAGSLVGAAGLILTKIMCRAMNRSLSNVAFGGFGQDVQTTRPKGSEEYTNVKSCTPEEAALILDNARSVIIVPGYGLAVARAQHAVKKMANILEEKGIGVKYAIHPVAGRMPGHMNVLLAEAKVPYDQLYEMDVINSEFEHTDAVLVIGANDVVNPSAKEEKGSPIYGMPVLDVDKAKSVIVIKRSLSPGFAGIKNPLFEKENCVMFFSDAKKAMDDLVAELEEM